jgi:hypothetical protein
MNSNCLLRDLVLTSMKSLDETRIEIRRHFDVENDDDVNVETKSLKASLKCPIGKLLFIHGCSYFSRSFVHDPGQKSEGTAVGELKVIKIMGGGAGGALFGYFYS